MANLGSSSRQSAEQQRIADVWQKLEQRESDRIKFASGHTPDTSIKAFYGTSEGLKEENKDKNAFPHDVIPYNRNRVVVGDRYLHASWVRELHGGQWWIVTQAPCENTEHTFLSLFLQDDVRPPSGLEEHDSLGSQQCRPRTIVRLETVMKSYIPSKLGEKIVVPAPSNSNESDLRLTLQHQSRSKGFIESKVRLVKCDKQNSDVDIGPYTDIRHFLFTRWSDMGVPEGEDRKLLLKLAQSADAANRKAPTGCHPNPPIVLHCRAGLGRTGTFAALVSIWRYYGLLPPSNPGQGSHASPPALAKSPLPALPGLAGDKVACEVESLRDQRYGMIERRSQFRFIYELAEEAKASQQSQQNISTQSARRTAHRTGEKSKSKKRKGGHSKRERGDSASRSRKAKRGHDPIVTE